MPWPKPKPKPVPSLVMPYPAAPFLTSPSRPRAPRPARAAAPPHECAAVAGAARPAVGRLSTPRAAQSTTDTRRYRRCPRRAWACRRWCRRWSRRLLPQRQLLRHRLTGGRAPQDLPAGIGAARAIPLQAVPPGGLPCHPCPSVSQQGIMDGAIPAHDDTELRSIPICRAPLLHVMRHLPVFFPVQAHVPLGLGGIWRVQQHAGEPELRRGRWPEHPRPVAATHAHVPQAGLQSRKPGIQAIATGTHGIDTLSHLPMTAPQMYALAMHALPGIPQVHELAMHAPPGIPQVHAPSLDPVAGVLHLHELALDTLPAPLATAPAAPDPAADAIEPPAGHLRIVIGGITHEPRREVLAMGDEPTMAGMLIGFVGGPVTPRGHAIRIGLEGSPDIGQERIFVVDRLDMRRMRTTQQHG